MPIGTGQYQSSLGSRLAGSKQKHYVPSTLSNRCGQSLFGKVGFVLKLPQETVVQIVWGGGPTVLFMLYFQVPETSWIVLQIPVARVLLRVQECC